MEDNKIIDLYWKRSESAIAETDKKYGRYCNTIAFNILHNREDAEECVNDTYFKVWGVIPTLRPLKFAAFIGRITRNLSLNKYEYYNAQKRGQGETQAVFEELQGCIAGSESVEDAIDDMLLTEKLNCFLERLPTVKRKVFMRRYWYLSSIKDIATDYQMSESKVKMLLLRTRNALKEYLEREGIVL